MTVYVDERQKNFRFDTWMIADTEAELHDMAARIGVSRDRFEMDHYPLTPRQRHLAIELGARAVSKQEFMAMVMARHSGQLLPTPESIQEMIAQAQHAPRPARLGWKAVASVVVTAGFGAVASVTALISSGLLFVFLAAQCSQETRRSLCLPLGEGFFETFLLAPFHYPFIAFLLGLVLMSLPRRHRQLGLSAALLGAVAYLSFSSCLGRSLYNCVLALQAGLLAIPTAIVLRSIWGGRGRATPQDAMR